MSDKNCLPCRPCSDFPAKERIGENIPAFTHGNQIDVLSELTKKDKTHEQLERIRELGVPRALSYLETPVLSRYGEVCCDSKRQEKIAALAAEVRQNKGKSEGVVSRPIFNGGRYISVKGSVHEKPERAIYSSNERQGGNGVSFPWKTVCLAAIAGAIWLTPDEFKNKVENGIQKYVLDYFEEPSEDTVDGLTNEPLTFTGTSVETSSGKVVREYFGQNKTQTHILEGFRFAFGSAFIDNPPMKTVGALGDLYDAGECSGYQLHGYTDSVGSEEDNRKLSFARASFIKSVLADNTDVSIESVEVFGHGESNHLWSNDTPEGRAKNRRVEVVCNRL